MVLSPKEERGEEMKPGVEKKEKKAALTKVCHRLRPF